MQYQDNYMTTNNLLDELVLQLQQDSVQKSKQLFVSEDLLNKISNQLNLQRQNADILVRQLLNSNLKHMNLLQTSNEKNKKLQIQINDLKQQIKKSQDRTARQIGINNDLNIKLKQKGQIQNSYNSMEKSLSNLQAVHQENEKKLLHMKEQNQRLKSVIQRFKAELSKMQPLKKQLQNLRTNYLNQIVRFSELIKEKSNKCHEFNRKRVNEQSFDEKKKEQSVSIAQRQEQYQNNQLKQTLLNQSDNNIDRSKQLAQIVINSQNVQKQSEDQNLDYQIEKLNDSQINITQQNNMKKGSLFNEINKIPKDMLLKLQQYISLSLDPQLQSNKIKLKQCQEKVKVRQQYIQKLINFIINRLLSPYSNKQQIKSTLLDVINDLNSNQLTRNHLKQLNTIVLNFENKKDIVISAKSGYVLNRI